MNIELENIGKKFRNEWIFKEVNYNFKSGNKYAITGFNGSGKSTLIQVISGLIPANLGRVSYKLDDNEIPEDEVYKHLFITAPYIDLIEEYSLSEALDLHFKFKPLQSGLDK
ncbi:MAG: ABC-type multidrug transport system ATPase subunit, partial [Arcticibacterium sp.]